MGTRHVVAIAVALCMAPVLGFQSAVMDGRVISSSVVSDPQAFVAVDFLGHENIGSSLLIRPPETVGDAMQLTNNAGTPVTVQPVVTGVLGTGKNPGDASTPGQWTVQAANAGGTMAAGSSMAISLSPTSVPNRDRGCYLITIGLSGSFASGAFSMSRSIYVQFGPGEGQGCL